MTLAVSQVLQNRYRTVALLGQGGMGAVYHAWDTRLDVPVALKEMTPQPGLDPRTLDQLRRQFRQEATILARMNHPHLVRVTDFFEESGSVYLVMDFVEGESLADQIEREGALPEHQVVAWAVQLLGALEYCHSQRVIHRDIKPQNIIICPNGQVELVDFGLVKLWDPSDPQTHTAMRGMGTPAYAPPEQYGVHPGHTDSRSDLYSLGATLYHALTGEPPATAGDRMASPETFTSMRFLNPHISEQVEATVMQAMELPLSRRFSSAREMAQALKGEAMVPSPVRAPVQSATVKTVASPINRRMPKWVWVAGGGAALMIGLIVLTVIMTLVLGDAGKAVVAWFQGQSQPTPESKTVLTSPASTSPAPQALATSVPLSQSRVVMSPENTDQMVELIRLGKGVLERATYSPDGSLVAVASSLGVYLYDAGTMEQVWLIETGTWVNDVAFSPDGALLAIVGRDRAIQLRKVSDGTLQDTLEGHTSWVLSVAFSPGGEMLVSGSSDDTVCLWRVSDGGLVHVLEGHEGDVTNVAFAPDGRVVASSSDDKTVRLWSTSDGTLLHTLEGHEGYVRGVALSPDGETLASGSDDGTVQLWQVSDGELLRTFEVEGSFGTSGARCVAFSPDGEMLAIGAMDDSVRLWKTSSGEEVYRLDEHTKPVTSVAFSPSGEMLLSTSDDGTVRQWQVSDGALLHTLTGFMDSVEYVAFSPDGVTLASAASYNTVQLWTLDGKDRRVLTDDVGDTTGLTFSPDGTLLAAASRDEIDFWQMHDESLLRVLKKDQVSKVKSLAFSPDGAVLAVGQQEGIVQLWQLSDKTLLYTWQAHTEDVISLTFSPDGRLLATGSTDETARVWETSDRTQVFEFDDYGFWVSSIAFSPDGSLLATASWDEISFWQVSDGALVRVLEGHEGQVESVVFSPDGALLASASDDDTLRLWRVSDGAMLRLINVHTDDVSDVAFSPDGTVLVSGSFDGTVRLWGVEESDG